MAKFYTDKAPTPVFAVTFVSNRKGIVPTQTAQTKDGKTTSLISTTQTNPEDFINAKYEFPGGDSPGGLKEQHQALLDDIRDFKNIIDYFTKRALDKREFNANTVYQNDNLFDRKFIGKSLNSLRQDLIDFRLKQLNGYTDATNSTLTDTTKDSEYLIYSNLQIQKTDDPDDLSQQSNWYLREAEVELTRDWPIQKAKLIVTCKLLDNGSIPPLVEVENGFVWEKDKDTFVKQLPTGRFLSADDEVRIYAGYKNDQCISMNDLDKYPFDFTNLETTGDIVADSADGLQLQQLQAEKKAIEEAIESLKNPLTDPLTQQIALAALALIVTRGLGSLGLLGKAALANAPAGGSATTAAARLAAEKAAQQAAATSSTTTTTAATTATTVNTTVTTGASTVTGAASVTTTTTVNPTATVLTKEAQLALKLNQNASTPNITNRTLEAIEKISYKNRLEAIETIKAGGGITRGIEGGASVNIKGQNGFLSLFKNSFNELNYYSALQQGYRVTFVRAFNDAIAKGLSPKKAFLAGTAAVTALINLPPSVQAAETNGSSQTRPSSEPFKAKLRDYLEGRQTGSDNKELFRLLELELADTNNLIQIIQKKAGVETKKYCADPNKIAPIFWGFIDSVDFISNSNAGVQIIYNLRDRSRILADTKLVTLPFLGTDASNKNTFEGLKHKTIESVYRATNGGIYLDNSYKTASTISWRSGFEKGEVISLYEDKDKKITDTKSALASERLKFTAAIEDPARWVIANAFLSSSVIKSTLLNDFDPLFHTWTLQGPLVTGSGNNTMQIINKSPFEILSYLAVTEVMPIDIFTSHINGHFMFAPRILDTSGLYDEARGNRLYYFFDCFDKLPEQRSLIKDIRVQTSTIGVYNRFTVLTADFGSSTNASLSGLTSIVDIASANTKNRKVPVKQHVIVDPKVKQFEANPQGAAQALALTTASTMARDNTTIIFKVIGDSSFYPGEAVRVFNTVLHSKDVFTFNATSTSTAVFLKSLYDEVEKIKATAIQQSGANKKVVDISDVIDRMRTAAGQESDDLNDALPMYKVRAITHSLKANGNDAGYTTKIVAVADIL